MRLCVFRSKVGIYPRATFHGFLTTGWPFDAAVPFQIQDSRQQYPKRRVFISSPPHDHGIPAQVMLS